MKVKMVRYIGGNASQYPCSDPKVLIRGSVYEVIATRAGVFQTTYALNGVAGWFDATWFQEATPSFNGIHMVVTNEVLAIGKSLSCLKVVVNQSECKLSAWNTTPIEKIKRLGENVWLVKAHHNAYVVQNSQSSEKMHMMVTRKIPMIHERCVGYKLVLGADEEWSLEEFQTGDVQAVKFVGWNVYLVKCLDFVYVLSVW